MSKRSRQQALKWYDMVPDRKGNLTQVLRSPFATFTVIPPSAPTKQTKTERKFLRRQEMLAKLEHSRNPVPKTFMQKMRDKLGM